jgi:hypothetical protein
VLHLCNGTDIVSISLEWRKEASKFMSPELERLIRIAREYREQNGFPADELARQVRSFAYGNTRLENDQITMDDIDNAMDSLRSKCEEPVRS